MITTKIEKIKKSTVIFIAVISCMILLLFISGCSVFDMIKETYTGSEETLELPEIKIDEEEIQEIGKNDTDIRKSYDIETEFDLTDESARNPFKPFFIRDEEEEEKNVLKLEKIYSRDEVEYADINLNGFTYRVKETDPLSDIYLVQAINDDSVALLKGDETINISLDKIIYD
ncbi:MAG: hypothetical protein PHQ09_02785 [Actinomycetota bacterium]|nr:hypothetical protein [Actinomycetota bacterium]